MVEQLFVMLKDKPDYTMPLLEARVLFPSFERQKSLKKAMLTHLFRQIFETRVSSVIIYKQIVFITLTPVACQTRYISICICSMYI